MGMLKNLTITIIFFALFQSVLSGISDSKNESFFEMIRKQNEHFSEDRNILIVSFQSAISRTCEVSKNRIRQLLPNQKAPEGTKVTKNPKTGIVFGLYKKEASYIINGQFKLLETINENGDLPDFTKKIDKEIHGAGLYETNVYPRITPLGKRLLPIVQNASCEPVCFLAISGKKNKDDILSYSFFGPLEKKDFKPISEMVKGILSYKENGNDEMLKKFLMSENPYLARYALCVAIKEKKNFVNLVFDSKLIHEQRYTVIIALKDIFLYFYGNQNMTSEFREFIINLAKTKQETQKELLPEFIDIIKDSSSLYIYNLCHSEKFQLELKKLAENQKDADLKGLYEKLEKTVKEKDSEETK
jgi:hypothetical protein